MRTTYILFTVNAILAQQTSCWALHWSNRTRLRAIAGATQDEILCRVTTYDTFYRGANGSAWSDKQISCIPIIDGFQSDEIVSIDLPADIAANYEEQIHRAALFVSIAGVTTIGDKIVVSRNARYTVLDKVPGHLRHLDSWVHFTSGTRSLTVIRVSTSDATPMFSVAELENGIFGNGLANDGITLSSQYNACSFGKMQWVRSEHGVMDVRINQAVSSFPDAGSLVTAASTQLKDQLQISSLEVLADRVLMCLPPGTGDWAGSAGIGHYRAQFNNEWCLSLTATVHELGHTMGLIHSNMNGQPYADTTGYMAGGYVHASFYVLSTLFMCSY
jgi:Gametolysin peptidase M11